MPFGRSTLAIVLFASALLANAGEPKADDSAERARRLLEQLGSESYSERDHASSELYAMGRAAIEALEYASHSEDTQVRIEASRLLIKLRGRGFMGVMPQEEQPSEAITYSGDDSPTVQSYTPPVVIIRQVAKPSDTPTPNGRVAEDRLFPAEAAGVVANDKVLAINNRPIYGFRDLLREVINLGPGRVAQVLIERDGKKLRLPLVLTHNPGDGPPRFDLEKEANGATSNAKTPKNILDKPARVVLKKPDPPDQAPQKDLKAPEEASDR